MKTEEGEKTYGDHQRCYYGEILNRNYGTEDLDIILLIYKRNMYKAVKNHVKIRISRKYYGLIQKIMEQAVKSNHKSIGMP